jgi:tRNA-2-methylthio-N6-dimethylallyladenosine synthase
MEHVHMPLQAGDDDVLRAMKRLYTRESFLAIIRELREKVPQVGITTDIIVGFPGETEEQFLRTMDVVREVRFDGAYMFIYSPRPDTPAASEEQLPDEVKKDRMYRLVALQNEITLGRNSERLGQEFEVLVEGASPKNPGRFQGYSREFTMMHFDGSPEMIGTRVRVRATQAHPWGCSGEVV